LAWLRCELRYEIVAQAFTPEDLDRARAAWPGVEISPGELEVYVRERGSADGAHLGDLYLACACLKGDRVALEAFDRAFADVIGASLGRFDLSRGERDDVIQTLRVGFFVKRKLAGYSGRGPLRGWVRSAATRAALDVVGARKLRPDREAEILDGIPATGDPELDLIRLRFASEFRAAFTETLNALDAEDRMVLAQHYVDDLSIDQLAVVLGVHRATAARRVVRLRGELLDGTRRRLEQHLRVDERDLDSLMRLAASRLQVSVFRLLRE